MELEIPKDKYSQFLEALATISTKKLYVLEIGK
jgi:hypothetical protein